MKKGLLSILAGSLLVVGCQNYDDQFDNLESQISALASTVAGLSQVQTDLAALSGTVASLQSSISDTVDSALADGLADIDAAVQSLEDATADVASAEDLEAIQQGLDANAENLEELLQQSSVFNNSIEINSVATLDAYHSMGSAIAIVNGDVTITMKADMDETKMQEVADQLLTVTQDFSYTSNASSIAEVVFTNLSGVQSLTIEQAGGYHFPNLVSATNIDLGDAYDNKVVRIDFPALETVTDFKTEGVANSILFDKSLTLTLTALKRYGNSTSSDPLDINLETGATLDIAALDDVDTNGEQDDIFLDISGPATFTSSTIDDGEITLADVRTVSITDFDGKVTIGADVDSVTLVKGVEVDLSSAVDLTEVNLDMQLDPDTTLSAADIAKLKYNGRSSTHDHAITFSNSADDLTDITISGEVHDITIGSASDGLGNLTNLTISAVANDLTVEGNSDLVSVSLTGASFRDVKFNANNDLEGLVLDHTTILTKEDATAEKAGQVVVTSNTKLSTLAVGADDLDKVEITGNTKLESIDFTGLADSGTATSVDVDIWGNKLSATLATDSYDTDITYSSNVPSTADDEYATSDDAGSYTHETKLATMAPFFANALTIAEYSVIVYFDEVDSRVNKGETAAGDNEPTVSAVTWTSAPTSSDATDIHAIIHSTNTVTNSAKPQTGTFVINAEHLVNQQNSKMVFAAAGGDRFTATYPLSGAGQVVDWNTTDHSTIASYLTYFNTEADLDNFDVTMANDAHKAHVFALNYFNPSGTSATLTSFGNGTVKFTFGTETNITAVLTGNASTAQALASAIAKGISNISGGDSFVADTEGTSTNPFVVVRPAYAVSKTDITNAPKVSIPTSLAISDTTAGASFSWVNNASTSSYTLSFSTAFARYGGFSIIAKNNTPGVNRMISAATMTIGGGSGGTVSVLTAGSYYKAGDLDNDGTAAEDAEIGGYIRSYANSSAGSSTSGLDTDRSSWL